MLNELLDRLELLDHQYKLMLVRYEADHHNPSIPPKVKKLKDWIDQVKADIDKVTVSEVPDMTGTEGSWKPGAW